MRKLATLIGAIICLSIMDKPKREAPPRVVNNYFIKSGGCGGCGKCRH